MRKYIKGCFAGCLWYFGFVVALMLGTGVLHIIGVTSDKAMSEIRKEDIATKK